MGLLICILEDLFIETSNLRIFLSIMTICILLCFCSCSMSLCFSTPFIFFCRLSFFLLLSFFSLLVSLLCLGMFSVKIADLGLSRKLDLEHSSFHPSSSFAPGGGSLGWRAPEVLRAGQGEGFGSMQPEKIEEEPRITRGVDIWALGCVMYFVLSKGHHPYGDRSALIISASCYSFSSDPFLCSVERDFNILNDRLALDLNSLNQDLIAYDLIESMLSPSSEARYARNVWILVVIKQKNEKERKAGRRENWCCSCADRHFPSSSVLHSLRLPLHLKLLMRVILVVSFCSSSSWCCLTRPTAFECVSHPFFWSDDRKLSFLQDISDRMEPLAVDDPIRRASEKQARAVVGSNWSTHLDERLLDNLGKYRKYDFASIRDLLRCIRNKKNHFRDLPSEIQQLLGSLPTGFLNYFLDRFPLLFLVTYYCFGVFCADEPEFAKYYPGISSATRQRFAAKLNLAHRPWWPPQVWFYSCLFLLV